MFFYAFLFTDERTVFIASLSKITIVRDYNFQNCDYVFSTKTSYNINMYTYRSCALN